MRILAITTIFPRPGHETDAPYNDLQFRELAGEHEVSVIAPVAWTDEVKDWLKGRLVPRFYVTGRGVEVHHPRYYFTPKVRQDRYGESYLASIRPTFERVVRARRPDVVLGCYAHPDGWAAVKLARAAGLPVVVKSHGSGVLVATRNPRRRAKVVEAVAEADGVVAVSEHLARAIVALGANPARVAVVHHGLDLARFRPGDRAGARTLLGLPSEGHILLYVGNLKISKGLGVLIDACGLLAAAGERFRCHVVGRGPDEAVVRRLIGRRGLGRDVTLVGSRRQEELPPWYHASDVVALPSFSEGIPNVLREAQACGRPFVASRVGGIPEIADPQTSRLVDPGSAPQLAEALAEMLRRPPPAEAARAAAAKFIDWPESARRLVERLQAATAVAADRGRPGAGWAPQSPALSKGAR